MKLRGASLVLLKIGVIGVSSGLILGLSFYVSIRMVIFGNEVSVPDLTGHTLDQSVAIIEGTGLTLEKTAERFDPHVPAGEVITQLPPPGATIKQRRKVRVVISLGTEVLVVPDLTGETERRAALEIERLGLQLGEISRVGTTIGPVDRVIAQDPMPGTDIFRGETVSLLVSRGRPVAAYVMPDMVGHPLEDVERALSTVGFRLSRTTYRDDWTPAGTVLRQFPLAGYPVTRRDPITVIVSRGPTA